MGEDSFGDLQEILLNRRFLLFLSLFLLGELLFQMVKLKKPSPDLYTAMRLLFLLLLLTSLTLWVTGPLRNYMLTNLYRTEFIETVIKLLVGAGTLVLSLLEATEIRRYERGTLRP
jgi:hypothetical protein